MFKSHPLVFPSREADLTAASFVADIHARVPTTCGEPVKFLNKALVTSAELHTATQPTLDQRFPNTKPVVPKNIHSVQLPRRQPVPQQSNHLGSKPITSQANSILCVPPANPFIGQVSTVRTVPIFKAKLSSKAVEKQQPQTSRETGLFRNRNDAAIVPMFKPKPTSKKQASTKVSSKQVYVQKEKGQTGRSKPPPPKRPCFTPALSQSNNTPTTIHNATTSRAISIIQPREMLTQQIVPDIDTSLSSIGPQELSFGSPCPKPVQKQAKPRSKGPPKERIQVEGVGSDIMDKVIIT